MFLALGATILLVTSIPKWIAERHGPIIPESVHIAGQPNTPVPAPEDVPKPVISEFSPDQIARGKSVHERILSNYPGIHAFYKKAYLWGALTEEPLSMIAVPTTDWKTLSEAERNALDAYAASWVNSIRSSPFDFSNIPSDAPAARLVRQKVSKMTADSWGIMTGPVSPDGHAIMTDNLVVKGR